MRWKLDELGLQLELELELKSDAKSTPSFFSRNRQSRVGGRGPIPMSCDVVTFCTA